MPVNGVHPTSVQSLLNGTEIQALEPSYLPQLILFLLEQALEGDFGQNQPSAFLENTQQLRRRGTYLVVRKRVSSSVITKAV